MIKESQPELHEEFQKMKLELVTEGFLANLEVKPTLEDQLPVTHKNDVDIKEIKLNMKGRKARDFTEDEQGTIWLKESICVLDWKELRNLILRRLMSQSTQFNQAVQRCISISRIDFGGLV